MSSRCFLGIISYNTGMIEGPGKPLNYSKLKDQKKFQALDEMSQKMEISRAQDEANMLQEWMIIDKVQPTTEKASIYMKKLTKIRRLYPNSHPNLISSRIGLEGEKINEEYQKYLNMEGEMFEIKDLIKKIKNNNPGIKEEDIVRIVKNLVVLCTETDSFDMAQRLASEYLEDEALVDKILLLEEKWNQETRNLVQDDNITKTEIRKNLEPVLVFQMSLILELKSLIERDPNIDRQKLQRKLLKGLEQWKDKPLVYNELVEEFTNHLDRLMYRRDDIKEFEKEYKENETQALEKVLGFVPTKPVKIIYGPWSISILLEESDFKTAKQKTKKTSTAAGWHIQDTPFNIMDKNPKDYVVKHEDLHALEDLLRRVYPGIETRASRVIRLLDNMAPLTIIKLEFQLVMKSCLNRIKEEILNGFHEGEDLPFETLLLMEIFGEKAKFKTDRVNDIQERISEIYIEYYDKLYDKIIAAAAKNPKPEVKEYAEFQKRLFFTKVARGIRTYGKALEDVAENGSLNGDEESLYILGNLLPLHQYYRIPGIIKRLDSVN